MDQDNNIISTSLKAVTFVVAAFTLIIMCSCSGLSSDTATASTSQDNAATSNTFEMPANETAFYGPAMDTAPVIGGETSVSSSLVKFITTDWDSGNPVYEVYNTFQSYSYPEDEGIIDVSNIYKLLSEAGNQYDRIVNAAEVLDEPTAIASPFDFGNEPVEYTHAYENGALMKDGDTIHALMPWVWDESPKMSYGVFEGSYNLVSGDIDIDMAYLVDYETDSDYCLRAQISGNDKTHEFTLKTGKVGTEAETYGISMVGAGVSQSDDTDAYFLIKIIDNGNLAEFGTEGRYYRFSANADLDDLREHPANGYSLDEIDDPDNYAEIIEAMEPLAIDGSDHATSLDDFTNGTVALDI